MFCTRQEQVSSSTVVRLSITMIKMFIIFHRVIYRKRKSVQILYRLLSLYKICTDLGVFSDQGYCCCCVGEIISIECCIIIRFFASMYRTQSVWFSTRWTTHTTSRFLEMTHLTRKKLFIFILICCFSFTSFLPEK